MLQDVHPDLHEDNPPGPHQWHAGFGAMVTAGVEDGQHLFPLARVIASRNDLSYPAHNAADRQFIEQLLVPLGEPLDYDAIFDKATRHVGETWSVVARGVVRDDEEYLSRLGAWNLDTGVDESGGLVFW
jgi:hypothetical protein